MEWTCQLPGDWNWQR